MAARQELDTTHPVSTAAFVDAAAGDDGGNSHRMRWAFHKLLQIAATTGLVAIICFLTVRPLGHSPTTVAEASISTARTSHAEKVYLRRAKKSAQQHVNEVLSTTAPPHSLPLAIGGSGGGGTGLELATPPAIAVSTANGTDYAMVTVAEVAGSSPGCECHSSSLSQCECSAECTAAEVDHLCSEMLGPRMCFYVDTTVVCECQGYCSNDVTCAAACDDATGCLWTGSWCEARRGIFWSTDG